ncbi:hypothetical protein CFP56_034300 [Quercus suber]|uniref:Prolamin-like domain-containing protein n=1 Tax=Quercus suber TaxID=58331 RepID=A0AAW0JDM3_QUESU
MPYGIVDKHELMGGEHDIGDDSETCIVSHVSKKTHSQHMQPRWKRIERIQEKDEMFDKGVLLKFLVHLSTANLALLAPLVVKPSRRLREIACLICSPPIPSLLLCSITLVVNHLKGNEEVSGITASVPGCLTDVMNLLFNGRVNFFGPTCCKAITLVSDHCLPKLFPFNLAFHSTLKTNWEKDIAKCWSSLSSINRYAKEIYGTFSRGEFSVVSLACCKSITVINHKCWPKMFPLNPLFPPLLKSKCARSASSLHLGHCMSTIIWELGKRRCKMLVITFKH